MLTCHESRSAASGVVMLNLLLVGGTGRAAPGGGPYSERPLPLVPELTGIDARNSRSARSKSVGNWRICVPPPERWRRSPDRNHRFGLLGRSALRPDLTTPDFGLRDSGGVGHAFARAGADQSPLGLGAGPYHSGDEVELGVFCLALIRPRARCGVTQASGGFRLVIVGFEPVAWQSSCPRRKLGSTGSASPGWP
jgi:hypothetical protein